MVNRYNLQYAYGRAYMQECKNGEYIDYKDYELILLNYREALRALSGYGCNVDMEIRRVIGG